jgi:chlorite dismutase
MNARLYTFVGGDAGSWRVAGTRLLSGEALPEAARLDIVAGLVTPQSHPGSAWALRGITSNERYVTRTEKTELAARQQGLGRPEATCAALIPIRKNAGWWTLTQDERRRIFEQDSHHIEIGLRYLPAVARRLHHCRDISETEPFDFITWFEFAPAHQAGFDKLVEELRASEEWRYVEREVDIRLVREQN